MTARLKVYTFNQLTILLDGQPVTGLSSRTAKALLVYLMCHERPLSRQLLADFFWDDRPADRAAANLRTVLTMLRKVFDDYLLVDRYTVGFNHEQGYWLDVAVLGKQLAQLEAVVPLSTPLTEEQVLALQTAVDLYQGDFLAGFHISESRQFEEWTRFTQEQLSRSVEVALHRLVARCLENGLYEMGLAYVTRLLQLDPYHEAAHQQMMWLLVRNGQRHAALDHYEACRQLLAVELGVAPSPQTTAVYNQIFSLDFPPRYQLPHQSTPFLGRTAEITAVDRQLSHPHCRLLSLLGPGGVGKSRLAIATASHLWRQRPGQFLHGLYFIPLETIESGREVPLLLAEKLNLPLRGSDEPIDQLLAYLQDKEVLLILDNVEHLLQKDGAEMVALFTRLLAEAHQVKLLVTSRHRLHLRDEWLFDVAGLDYAPEGNGLATEQYSASQLFLYHARRIRHNFRPTVADWQAIARLSQLLEGLPLGLELAAAWVRQLGCHEIVARLEEAPEQLATAYHDVPLRQRSLTAVFNYSWQLLSQTEQQLLARLTVFRGSFTPEMATAVLQAEPLLLRGLVDKSLLYQDETNGRFAIHPLLRQFAAEHLNQEEQVAVTAVHGRYFAQQLAAGEKRLHSPDEQQWLEQLRANLPDLRAAWLWASRQANEDSGPLMQMLYSLAYLYDVQALYREGVELWQTAVAQAAPTNQPNLQGQLLTWLGHFLYQIGKFDEARQSLETALAHLRPLAQPAALALALTYRGELARYEGLLAAARHYQDESVAWARQAASEPIEALALLHTGKIEIAEGEYQAAQRVCTAGLILAQRGGAPRQIAIFEDNLGTVFLELGDHQTARQKFARAYELRQTLGDQWGLAASLNNLGVLALIIGSYDEAAEKYRLAESVFRQIGYRWGVALALTNLGRAFCYQGVYEMASATLNQALYLWREVGSGLEEGDAWFYLGQAALLGGRYEEARGYLEKSLALFTAMGDDRQLPIVWRDLGVTLTRLGQMAEAGAYLRLSLEAGVAQSLTADVVYTLSGWAVWLAAHGEREVAGRLLRLAATHPAAWHHERAEAARWLAELALGDTADLTQTLTVETAVALLAGRG